MSTTKHTIVASAAFGEFGRYQLTVAVTRYNAIAFFVSDVEIPGIAGAETIRVTDSLPDAVAGLQSNAFRMVARPGDTVINLSSTVGVCVLIDAERGWLLQCPTTGQQWYASPNRCWVLRDDCVCEAWD